MNKDCHQCDNRNEKVKNAFKAIWTISISNPIKDAIFSNINGHYITKNSYIRGALLKLSQYVNKLNSVLFLKLI